MSKSPIKISLSLILALLLCPTRRSFAENQELHLGAVLSLTGPAAVDGKAIQEGIEFEKKQLQEKGWKVQIDYEDDGTEPKRTISSIERIAGSGTKLFIGPTWGLLAEPAVPVLTRSHSLSLQPCNSSEFVDGGSGRFFFFLPPLRKMEPVLVRWFRENGIHSAALIIATSHWGELHEKIFLQAAQEANVHILSNDGFQYGEERTAIPSLITKFRTSKPDVVLTTSSMEIAALTAAQLDRLQISTKLLSPELGDAVIEKLVPASSRYFQGYWLHPERDEDFTHAYLKWKGVPPHRYADAGARALMAFSEAVHAVGADAEKIKSYFEKQSASGGNGSKIVFDEHHDIAGGNYEIDDIVQRQE